MINPSWWFLTTAFKIVSQIESLPQSMGKNKVSTLPLEKAPPVWLVELGYIGRIYKFVDVLESRACLLVAGISSAKPAQLVS